MPKIIISHEQLKVRREFAAFFKFKNIGIL